MPVENEISEEIRDTLPRMVLQRSGRWGTRAALSQKVSGAYRDISWDETGHRIRRFGRALLGMGVRPGDRVAIMAPNGPDWVYADLGAMACGALSVPVYHTEGISTVLHILRDSGSRYLFLYSPVIWTELAGRLGEVPDLENVILLQGEGEYPPALGLESFLAGAEEIEDGQLDQRLEAGTAEDPATIIYTSGTTGPPKGAVLSHRNLLSNVAACVRLFQVGPQDRSLSFLPLSHVFERMGGYYLMLHQGAVIAYAENFDSVPANLLEVRPTVVTSVPRLYEKMYARVLERVLSGSWLKKQLFFFALKVAKRFVADQQAGREPGHLVKLGTKLGRRVVFRHLAERLGGRLRFFISGGAPLGKDIGEFFMAAGLPILEGYGLTETSPVIAVNTLQAVRIGTVGRPLTGTEVRTAEDGEILVRGPGVFRGYWNDPERTAEAFIDGWFRTGDIGEVDRDGFLAITDRKKDLIVTAGGENIAPQVLENRLKTNKFLSNALVLGDRKPYLTALLVPNFENLENYARRHNLDFLNHCDLVNLPGVLVKVREEIDTMQHDLPPIQHIKRFTLLSRDFSSEEGELTPTLKIKRKIVQEHFHRVLDGMYEPGGEGIHDRGFCVVED